MINFLRVPKDRVTIARMRVRLPYSVPVIHSGPNLHKLTTYANWFALCTMSPQPHPLALSKFQLYQKTSDEPTRYHVEPGGYETGLWADQFHFCRELGCKITIEHAYGWREWGVPPEWKAPLPPHLYKARVVKERMVIYAFVNELTQEVYVGQTNNIKRRQVQHLRDTTNTAKAALLQSLRTQGHDLNPIILEEVAGVKATERESYWTSYYKSQGFKITNHDLFF